MLSFTRLNDSTFNSVKNRILKVLRMGKNDVQTSFEAAPYGVDSNPIKDMEAIYGKTTKAGKTVILGYINKNQLAAVGENRIYSTDSNGNLKFYVWLKNDGTCELGGDADNGVRYSPLNSELTAFKNALQAELTLIQAGIASAGGSYSPSTLSLDISQAKIDEIKTL